MSEGDWHDFTQGGPSWSPAEKGRVVVLKKDVVSVQHRVVGAQLGASNILLCLEA